MPFVLSLCFALMVWVQPLHANNTADRPLRLVAFGDSLTAGYGLPEREAFPGQLQQALEKAGYHIEVSNAGVSGDTTAGALSRLDWALAGAPDLVIVALGGNDALRGLPPEMTRDNLDRIIKGILQKGSQVLLAGMRAPRNLGNDYVEAFDAIYPLLAKRHNVTYYPFFLEGIALVPELNQADGIHPNAAGVKVLVEALLPYIESALQQPTH